MIGLEVETVDDGEGSLISALARIVGDFNCGGMLRAWVDWDGELKVRIWRQDEKIDPET